MGLLFCVGSFELLSLVLIVMALVTGKIARKGDKPPITDPHAIRFYVVGLVLLMVMWLVPLIWPDVVGYAILGWVVGFVSVQLRVDYLDKRAGDPRKAKRKRKRKRRPKFGPKGIYDSRWPY